MMRKLYETAVILLGTLGWWGFVYPELCLSDDVYEEKAEWEPGTIYIKSRVAEYVYQIEENTAVEKRAENDKQKFACGGF